MRSFRCCLLVFTLSLFALRVHAQTNLVTCVNAADYSNLNITYNSIVAAFGSKLSVVTVAAVNVSSTPGKRELPTSLGDTTVRVGGILAPLFYVSPTQVNFLMPPTLTSAQLNSEGFAEVVVRSGDGVISEGRIYMQPAAISIFTFAGTGRGLPAGYTVRVKPNLQQLTEPLGELNPATNMWAARPLDLSSAGDRLFLVLYGTGIRQLKDENGDGNVREDLIVNINGQELTPSYAGPHPSLLGLDQINVEIPPSFYGQPLLSMWLHSRSNLASSSAELQLQARVPALTNLTWTRQGLSNRIIHALAARDAILLAATHAGLYRSLDNGQNWSSIAPFDQVNLPVLQQGAGFYNFFRLSTGLPSNLGYQSLLGDEWFTLAAASETGFAGRTIQTFGGDFAGTDAGLFSLQAVENRRFYYVWQRETDFPAHSIKAIVWEPQNRQFLIGTQGNGAFVGTETTPRVWTWRPITQGLPANATINALSVTGDYVFAAVANQGVYRSSNNGAAWAASNNGLPPLLNVTALASYGQNIIVGAASGVYLSNDYGQSWHAANTGLNNLNVRSLWFDHLRLAVGTAEGVYLASSFGYFNTPLPTARETLVTLDEDTRKTFALNTSLTGTPPANWYAKILTNPQLGTVTLNGLNVSYTPKLNETGSDSFTYVITDGIVTSLPAEAKITITPINDAPVLSVTRNGGVLNNGDQLTIAVNVPLRLDLNGVDVEASPLKLTLANPPAGATLAPKTGEANAYQFNWTPTAVGTQQLAFTLSEDTPAPQGVTVILTVSVVRP